MKYEIAAFWCAFVLNADGLEEKLCAYYRPEEPNQMTLSECRDERVNLRIIALQQQMVSIITCMEPEQKDKQS